MIHGLYTCYENISLENMFTNFALDDVVPVKNTMYQYFAYRSSKVLRTYL